MSQSIDFRINDLINEYLDYKGYSRTVAAFHEERQVRQEPIDQTLNGNSSNKERVKVLHIKDTMLQHFDRGHREEFFQLWHEHIRSDLVDQDPSLKSLEFLLYTHFAIYHLRSDRDDEQTQENMQIFKTYIESIKGQAISQTSEILPLFALPYVAAPDQHPSFKDLFSNEWPVQLRTKLSNFLEWIFSTRALPNLVGLLQNGERAVEMLTQFNDKNEELEDQSKETNRQIKHLSSDYFNLINITMELVETLQQAIVGRTITNEYIDNVCARLGLARLQQTMPYISNSSRPGTTDILTERLDYGKIKRDIVHISVSSRERAFLLQALRWKLTKAKTDFRREKILECYIGCDLLGCRSDIEQRTKIIQQLSSSSGGDTYYVKEEWARLMNTIASLRKGRNYLSPNESLIVCMLKTAIAEQSDTQIKQHLLASLQKLSLRRSVQSILITQNIIKWLISLLSKADRLSDYTLEYAVALLMNLCLRTQGRRKCAEIADQAINVLSSLLTHPNQETRPYVNSSLYSILTLKVVRDKAMQLNLDNRLRTLIRNETINSETKGQLEFLLNLLCKGGEQDGRQTSDNEQDNDDEDQDVMEADLDLGDKLRATEKESSGDQLISKQYLSTKGNKRLYGSSMDDYSTKTKVDPVLQRPTTPGQLRQSITSQAVDSIAQSFAKNQMYHSRSGGFENTLGPPAFNSTSSKNLLTDGLASSTNNRTSNDQRRSAKFTPTAQPSATAELMRSVPLGKASSPAKSPVDDPSPRSESSASIHSSSSSIIDLNVNNEKASK